MLFICTPETCLMLVLHLDFLSSRAALSHFFMFKHFPSLCADHLLFPAVNGQSALGISTDFATLSSEYAQEASKKSS